MPIVGFEFTKIEAERLPTLRRAGLSIKNNFGIKNVEKVDLALGEGKQTAARFHFEYTTSYDPKGGSILLKGNVLFLSDNKIIEESVKSWKKNKKIDKNLMTIILNRILEKSSIQSLLLSDTLNLPAPVKMPKVGTQPPAKKK